MATSSPDRTVRSVHCFRGARRDRCSNIAATAPYGQSTLETQSEPALTSGGRRRGGAAWLRSAMPRSPGSRPRASTSRCSSSDAPKPPRHGDDRRALPAETARRAESCSSRCRGLLALRSGRLVRPLLVDGRAFHRFHRRRLRRRAHGDAVGQGLGLRRRGRRHGQRRGARRRRHRPHRRRRLQARGRGRAATTSRPSSATIERIGKQIAAQEAAVDAGQSPARLRQGRGHARRARAQAPAGSSPGTSSRASRRWSRRRPTATRRSRRCRAREAGVDGGADQRRRASGAEGRGRAHAEAARRPRSPRRSAISPSRSSARPFDGVIGNRAVQTGDYVQPGQRLASLVPARRRLCRCQLQGDAARRPASRPAGRHRGRCAARPRHQGHASSSVAPASGSVFSLLPPDNATGNFTKIVQRIPVRIRVPAAVGKQELLRPGMSVVVSVNTKPDAADDAPAGSRPPTVVDRRRQLSAAARQGVSSWPTTTRSSRPERQRRSHRSAPPRRLPGDGVRHVHGDPRHPDRVGLADRDPGRPCRQLERDHLGADGLPHRRGGDDPAVGVPVARARARASCSPSRRRALPPRA